MKIKEILNFGEGKFLQISDGPRREIELLVMSVLDCKKIDLILNFNEEVSKAHEIRINQGIKKRQRGLPLQYIIGTQEFMGLDFSVTPDVLIPRQDTEILVEKIIEAYKDQDNLKILDIGTGSGAIGISLAKFLKDVQVISVDISPKALEVAKKNAKKNEVDHKITFIQSDLFKSLTADESFDIILSNPPYIPSKDILKLQMEVKEYEPMVALDGGKDGLDYYREITEKSRHYLKTNGLLAYEIGFDQGLDVSNMLRSGFHDIEIIKDLQKKDRVVLGYCN